MPNAIRLSVLLNEIREALENRFEGDVFWITAEITDVKKYAMKRWCFLKFIEKQGTTISSEIKGVFWGGTYHFIPKFEQQTRQQFRDGLEITCLVRVNFHPRYGLTLEVLEIDFSYELGKLELERQAVLERLIAEHPQTIQLIDGQYETLNNNLPLPEVIQHIALITAPGSDGQRDFIQEMISNRYGYQFAIHEFPVQIQGDQSAEKIREQLQLIAKSTEKFDAVVMVRGGGSQTDFRPFEDYMLSGMVAAFPIPVLTGIGHDRNISIVDMMARSHKTPTKAATFIIDHNYSFERAVLDLKERFFGRLEELMIEETMAFDRLKTVLPEKISGYLKRKTNDLEAMRRLTKNLSPSVLLAKGFALVMSGDKIITDPEKITKHTSLKTILKTTVIHSTVMEKTYYESQHEL